MEQAWGNSLSIYKTAPLVDDTHLFFFRAVTPDARYLVGSILSRVRNELGGASPASAALRDVNTQELTVMHRFPKNDTQMISASADDKWVVWTEASENPGFFAEWEIYSYNRQTKDVRVVAQAPRDTEGNIYAGGPLVAPVVDHGVAVWTQIPPTGPDRVHALVMSADLTSGKLSTLTDLGQQATISWPYVAWEGPSTPVSATMSVRPDTQVFVHNMESGITKALTTTHNTSYFALYKGDVVWISEHGDLVYLTDVNETENRLIASVNTTEADVQEGDLLQYPSLNSRLVTWVSYNRVAVWDRAEQKLVNVVTPYKLQGSSMLNGDAYAWQSGGSLEQMSSSQGDLAATDVIFNVLNTSTLPVISK